MDLRKNRAFAFGMVTVAYILAIIAGVVCYHYLPFAFWWNLLIADIAATVTELLGVAYETSGRSFAKEIL